MRVAGRLAQLVQSVCLTSRGSGVRIPQRPQKRKEHILPFCVNIKTVRDSDSL